MGEYSDGDPFEDASDGDGSCGEEEDDDDGCLGLSRGPSDEEEDDDSNGEGMCEVPCCFDDDDDIDDIEEEDDIEGEEELCDEEGNGEEVVDDPCDEDDYEGDVEAEDLCEDSSSNDGEEGEREVVTVSGFSIADGSHISEPVLDDSSSSSSSSSSSYSDEDDGSERFMPFALPIRPPPSPWATAHLLPDAVAEHTDSDDDIGNATDDTDYDDDEYEQHRLPASRAAVESLPEAALDEEEAARGCAVCKDVFASGQRVVRLPCKHYFHGDCIWPWLAIRSTCPMCRHQLPTDDAESRLAPQLGALVPVAVARHGEAQQSGGRDGGDGSRATTGGGDALD
ncbi:hypothetical protein QYE76_021194 [Lolium multiflorum]|uniref:RING-type E3 ubiquitin transferase n=1 Tax=Lolium multiflorum TaxID=4521 RepID=A0AAD8VPY9_LOLMU|nr:hypothetical protein QYE76_021194 [Lolium multiflorum]